MKNGSKEKTKFQQKTFFRFHRQTNKTKYEFFLVLTRTFSFPFPEGLVEMPIGSRDLLSLLEYYLLVSEG